jgi:hypothetical protein
MLDVFSGRPNPTWQLTSSESRQLIDHVAGRAVRPVTARAPILGFRGFVVQAEPEDATWRAGLPPTFAVAHPDTPPLPRERPGHGRRAAAAQTEAAPQAQPGSEGEAAEFLLRTAERVVDVGVLDAVRTSVEARVRSAETDLRSARKEAARAEAPPAPEPRLERFLAGPACEPFLTPVRAEFWSHPSILLNNNCYNYATNFVSFTTAQPGRRAGQVYTAFECDAVVNAARADGYLTSCEGTVRVVALAVWPSYDFHWWRLHPGGAWAHKLGLTPVTNRDNRGRPLENGLTPETCDRGPYTTFCGYYYGPLGMAVL